jgi:hypothetical protein
MCDEEGRSTVMTAVMYQERAISQETWVTLHVTREVFNVMRAVLHPI